MDVDGQDLLAWQRNIGLHAGAVKEQGDADNDGRVDGEDLAVWNAQFGSQAALTGSTVPEPSVLGLTALAAVFSCRRLRRG
jgi:hypothetical protein